MLFHTKQYKLLLERVDAAERSSASLLEQQRQLHEALTHHQAEYEGEVAALRETVTSQAAQIREIVELTTQPARVMGGPSRRQSPSA